ncbi:MAG: hypothetical protein RL318_2828, partial [Fibrobacterota bacterium]
SIALHALHAAPWTGIWPNRVNHRTVAVHVADHSPAAQAGMLPGDTIVRIQDSLIPSLATVRDRDYLSTWEEEGQFWAARRWLERTISVNAPLKLEILRAGKSRTIELVPAPTAWHDLLKRLLPVLIVGSTFLLTGLFVASRLWNLSAKLNLIAGAGIFVITVTLASFNSRDLAYPVDLHLLLQIGNELAVFVMGSAYVHFSWIFPRPHPLLKRHPRLPWLLWTGMAVLGGLHFTRLLPGPVLAPNLAILFAGIFLLISIFSSAVSIRGAMQRRQLQWFVIGLGCGILPIVLLTLLPLLVGMPFVPEEITFLGTVIVPISMAISISRWRLVELPLLLARMLASGLSILALILASLGTLRLFNGANDSPQMRTVVIGLLLTIALIVHPYLRLALFRLFQGLGKRPLLGVDLVLEQFLHCHAVGSSVEDSMKVTFQQTLNLPLLTDHPWVVAHRSALQPVLDDCSRPVSGETLAELLGEEIPTEIEASVLVGLGDCAEILVLGPRWNPDGWTRGDMEILGALCAIATPLIKAQEARTQAEVLRRQQLETAKNTLEQRVEERTRELESANAKLSQALLAREDFLATMSHELRTPLSTVLGAAETILAGIDGQPTQAMKVRLATMLRNGRHLRELIGDVLDFARGRAGRLPVQKEPFRVQEVCQEAMDLVRTRSPLEENAFECVLPQEAIAAIGDPLRTRQILTNLMANAKLHGGGRVTLSLTASEDRIHLKVCDHGAGIPPDQVPRLFQAFERLERDTTAGATGSGLGLALSHMLAGFMDGDLTYKPREGGGSCFELVLPRSAEVPSSASLTDNSSVTGANPGHLVLVEDHAELREMLKDYLLAQGWEIDMFADALSALASCQARMPDILLTDIGLPGISGLELVRQIRALPDGKALHIIALTGQVMPEDTRSCLEAGADAVLPKPFPLSKLDRILRELPVNRPHD